MIGKGALGGAWSFIAAADRLLKLEQKTNEAIADIQKQLAAMDKRMDQLEHRMDRLADDAKAAARAGAQDAMMGSMAEIGRRIGALEAQAAKPKRVTKRRDE